MKVRDVTTTAVTTLRSDTPVQVAVATLVSHGHSAAPVVEGGGALIGVVTEADLVRGRIVGIVTRRDVLRLVAHRRLQSEEAWAARTALVSHDRG